MDTTFLKLNRGWNAEPNAPEPRIETEGHDLVLTFLVNPYQYSEFKEDEMGMLRFIHVEKFRLGPTNDEGWYRGQCRFSKIAPKWGEFYLVTGDESLMNFPNDWRYLDSTKSSRKHFLFYFRDNTFECAAADWTLEATATNSLIRLES